MSDLARTEEVKEALYYTDMMMSALDFSDAENVEQLVDRQEMAAGIVFRIQVALVNFVKNVYNVDMSLAKEGTKSAEILSRLKKVYFFTFSLREEALNMSLDELRSNLEQARVQASALSILIAALEAGEDEEK